MNILETRVGCNLTQRFATRRDMNKDSTRTRMYLAIGLLVLQGIACGASGSFQVGGVCADVDPGDSAVTALEEVFKGPYRIKGTPVARITVHHRELGVEKTVKSDDPLSQNPIVHEGDRVCVDPE